MSRIHTSRQIRNTKVWKISLTDEEKAFFEAYAFEARISLKDLIDVAIQHAAKRGVLGMFETIVVPQEASKRFSIRVNAEQFTSFMTGIEKHFSYGNRKPINASNVLVSALWYYAEEVPCQSLEWRRKLLKARVNLVELSHPPVRQAS